MAKKVFVAGATGYLGGYIVKELKKRGYFIAALAREPAKLAKHDLTDYIDRQAIAEVTDSQSLKGIFDGIDCVISTVGITKQKDNLTYMDVDYQGNLNLLKEAKSAGVKKFIYVSVFNARKIMELEIIKAKERFSEMLKKSGIDYTIVRPNGFFSDIEEVLNMAKKGSVYLFGNGEYKGNPIHGEDLAEVCVDCAENDVKEIDIGGPEVLTQNEVAALAFSAINKKAKIRHIPLWMGRFFLTLLKKITSSKTFGPIEFFMTVLTMDMIAPQYGKHKLSDYFREKA